MIRPKDQRELALMRFAGQVVAETLDLLRGMIAPGVTTAELDQAAEALIRRRGCLPSFKGYQGFPATICASINQEIVHGIPGTRVLQDGDIISVDVGTIWQGYQGDAAVTVPVGQVKPELLRLIAGTDAALQAGIKAARTGVRLGDVSHAIEQVANQTGLAVVREYGGHGIGREMHEAPRIPNWGSKGRGIVLQEGMTLCLEPMLTLGHGAARVLSDGWTVVTADGSASAHSEHMIVVTADGGEIMTANGPDLA